MQNIPVAYEILVSKKLIDVIKVHEHIQAQQNLIFQLKLRE